MSRLFHQVLRILIVTVAAIAGWLAGHAGGPIRVELTQVATGLLCAVSAAGIAVVGCLFAIARYEKRSLNRKSDRHFVNMIQSNSQSAIRRPSAARSEPAIEAVRDGGGSALAVES